MKIGEIFDRNLPALAGRIYNEYKIFAEGESTIGMRGKIRVQNMTSILKSILFPGVFEAVPDEDMIDVFIQARLREAGMELRDLVYSAFDEDTDNAESRAERADEITIMFLDKLPVIREKLSLDIQAAYDGDPAARGKEEIILSYPGFEAVMIYRLAHELYLLGVPTIPRIMTEYAHQNTGIDIHPGASIGQSFFIDHGTGVVIGETCTIGDRVKMYQGVTLGARSFDLDENGNPVKGIKRHPNIGSDVIIYAGATILGGDTIIGDRSVIGGNVWLTHSIGNDSKVYNTAPVLKITKME